MHSDQKTNLNDTTGCIQLAQVKGLFKKQKADCFLTSEMPDKNKLREIKLQIKGELRDMKKSL